MVSDPWIIHRVGWFYKDWLFKIKDVKNKKDPSLKGRHSKGGSFNGSNIKIYTYTY
jgi:hypothetical protein